MQARQLWDGADGGLCSCVPRQEHLTRETVCWRRDGISHAIPEVEESQAWQLGGLAMSQAPGTAQGKMPRSKADA